MELIADLLGGSLVIFGLLLLAAQLIVHEGGYWLGRRYAADGERKGDHVGTVVGGMLGLLAFVLALTLSFATSRFDERRAGTLAEANAIGTAWLRAEALGQPRGTEIARLLAQYGQARMEFVQAAPHSAAIGISNQRSNALQAQIWGHLAAICREQPNPISASLMSAINDVFDMTTSERFAYDLKLPPQLFWLLIGLALLGMAAIGFELGVKGRPIRLMMALLTIMWTVVILVILDLASPRIGSLRTSVTAYQWTLSGFQSDIAIPPLPAK